MARRVASSALVSTPSGVIVLPFSRAKEISPFPRARRLECLQKCLVVGDRSVLRELEDDSRQVDRMQCCVQMTREEQLGRTIEAERQRRWQVRQGPERKFDS